MTTAQQTPVSTERPRRGWFGRNWKWFLPVSLLATILVGGGTAVLVSLWPNIQLKNSQAFADTLKEITTNPKVRAALGENVAMDQLFPSGTREERMITLTFSVKGSKGTGQANSMSQLIDGKWGLSRLVVAVKDGPELNLSRDILERENEMPKFDPSQPPKPSGVTDEPPPGDVNVNLDTPADKPKPK